MTNYFNILPSDIKSILNPTNNATGVLGVNSALKTADIEQLILRKTSYVCDRLPDRYKKLLQVIDGEWLCGKGKTNGGAVGNETTFYTSLKPISNLQLYKNFAGNWQKRNYTQRLAESEYTVDEETGEITLNESLKSGDTLIAYYDYNGLYECETLKEIVINLVVGYITKIIQMNENKVQNFAELEQQAYIDLSRLRDKSTDGSLKIDLFDRIELVVETDNGDFGSNGFISFGFNSGANI